MLAPLKIVGNGELLEFKGRSIKPLEIKVTGRDPTMLYTQFIKNKSAMSLLVLGVAVTSAYALLNDEPKEDNLSFLEALAEATGQTGGRRAYTFKEVLSNLQSAFNLSTLRSPSLSADERQTVAGELKRLYNVQDVLVDENWSIIETLSPTSVQPIVTNDLVALIRNLQQSTSSENTLQTVVNALKLPGFAEGDAIALPLAWSYRTKPGVDASVYIIRQTLASCKTYVTVLDFIAEQLLGVFRNYIEGKDVGFLDPSQVKGLLHGYFAICFWLRGDTGKQDYLTTSIRRFRDLLLEVLPTLESRQYEDVRFVLIKSLFDLAQEGETQTSLFVRDLNSSIPLPKLDTCSAKGPIPTEWEEKEQVLAGKKEERFQWLQTELSEINRELLRLERNP